MQSLGGSLALMQYCSILVVHEASFPGSSDPCAYCSECNGCNCSLGYVVVPQSLIFFYFVIEFLDVFGVNT